VVRILDKIYAETLRKVRKGLAKVGLASKVRVVRKTLQGDLFINTEEAHLKADRSAL